MMKQFAVYIITNKTAGTLYVGVTSNLVQRIYEHKMGIIDGFSKRYNLHRLVYYESHDDAESAILYEKKLKNRPKAFKVKLIEACNPEWKDLYEKICC